MRDQRGANSALSVDLPKGDSGNCWELLGTCSFGGDIWHLLNTPFLAYLQHTSVRRRKALSRMPYERNFCGVFHKTITKEKLWDTIKESHIGS